MQSLDVMLDGLSQEDLERLHDMTDEEIVELIRQSSRLDLETPPDWFHLSQLETWRDEHPIVCICAGWQSGKTISLSYWLLREIQRCGPGDYGAFSSTFPLMVKKLLPEMKKVFGAVAEYLAGLKQFIFTDAGSRLVFGADWNGDATIVQLGYAVSPDSLESATLKAVIWDECGQRLVPEQSFNTVQSRLMVHRGRMCLASKPYESGWYERLVEEGLKNAEKRRLLAEGKEVDYDPVSDTVGVITYASWDNPVNPAEDSPYFAKIRAKMPTWKFVMQYGGRFTMPAGLIYDCFDWERNTCDDFAIFEAYPMASTHPGMDFGKINTGGLGVADTGDVIYVFGEYLAGEKRTYEKHVESIKALRNPHAMGREYGVGCGGNKHGEDGWREAYRQHGLPLDEPPENNIDVQIQAVWALMAQGKLKFFRAGARQCIEDVKHYSRKVDEDGKVLDEIDNDAIWHLLAALRYIIIKLRPNAANQGAAIAGGERLIVAAMTSNMARAGIAAVNQTMPVLKRFGSPFGLK